MRPLHIRLQFGQILFLKNPQTEKRLYKCMKQVVSELYFTDFIICYYLLWCIVMPEVLSARIVKLHCELSGGTQLKCGTVVFNQMLTQNLTPPHHKLTTPSQPSLF